MWKYSPVVWALAAFVSVPNFSLAQANPTGISQSVSEARSAVAISIQSDSSSVRSSDALQFTALIRNTPNVAVRWSATAGTISSTGLFRAPSVTRDTVVRVKATSVADPSKSEETSIVITAPQAKPAVSNTTVSKPTAATIKKSFFGADFNGFGVWPPTDGQKQVATLGTIRLWDDNVKWAQVETSNGVYDWSHLDTWMSKAQAQGMDVLYTIGNTPQWAGSIPCLLYTSPSPRDS